MIETNRLILRQMTYDDFDALYEIFSDAAKIKALGLDVPQGTEIADMLRENGVDLVYLSRTKGISSTELRSKLDAMDK